MVESLHSALAQCLQAIEQGRETPTEYLARYPEYRDELESLLETAALLRAAPEVSPRPAFRHVARRQLTSRLAERWPVTVWDRLTARWERSRQALHSGRLATVLTVFLALIVLLLGGGRAVAASEQVLPGDTLYPVKLVVEDLRLTFASDESAFRLYLQFANARVDEMERLSAEDRFEDVPLAASRFGRQVQRAAGVVTELGDQDDERSKVLGEELDASRNAQRASLNRLLETVPSSVRPSIERALRDVEDEHEEEDGDPLGEDSDWPGDQGDGTGSSTTDVDEIREGNSSDVQRDAPDPEGDVDDSSSDDQPGSVEGMDEGSKVDGGIHSEQDVGDTSDGGTDDDVDESDKTGSTVQTERKETDGEAGSSGETGDGGDESAEDSSVRDTDRESGEHSDPGDGSSDSSDGNSRSSSDDQPHDGREDEHHPDGERSDSSDSGSSSSSSGGSGNNDTASSAGSEHGPRDDLEHDSGASEARD